VINAHERDPKVYMQGIREPARRHRRDRPDGFLKALVTAG
jgi:hypothetical protein